jgi:hypothetical protein
MQAILVVFAASLMTLLPYAPPPYARGATPTGVSSAGLGTLAVLDLVLLVDESGSETPQKVADEKASVETIVQSLLNPDSRVTVIGFGGVNHVAPSQVPTDVACVPTIASGAANLDYLSTCVSKLHRRTEAEGDDRDYAAALAQAMSYLSPSSTAMPPSPAGAIKVILMMTDGVPDVHRDTQPYGSDWQLGERTAISHQLSAAKAAGVQFWPLGFGTDFGNVDGTNITESSALSYLNTMARQAALSACGSTHTAVQPHATWVKNPEDAVNALDLIYADASCAGVNSRGGTLLRGLTATPEFAGGNSVTVGGTIPGEVVLTNQTGSAQQVQLVISVGSGATATLTSPAGPVSVPSGNPPAVPFTITVARSSRTGIAAIKVEAVNAATGQVLSTAVQDFAIGGPRPFLAAYLWAILAIVILAILATLAILAMLWRRAVRERRNVRGLEITIRRDGIQRGRGLMAPERKYAEVFPFVIRSEETPDPYLDHASRSATEVFHARRGERGYVRLMTPGALRLYDVELNGPGLTLPSGLELRFMDRRLPLPEGPGTAAHRLPATEDIAPGWRASGASDSRPPAPPQDPWL